MELATSPQIAEWLRKKFPQQNPQEQLSPEIQAVGQKASNYWNVVKDKVSQLSSRAENLAQKASKKLLYDPDTKRVLPDSVIYQLPEMAKQTLYNPETKKVLPAALFRKENMNNFNPEDLAMSFATGIGTGGMAGVTKAVPKGGMVKKIHVEDMREMADFTDYTGKKWKPADKGAYEGNIRDMAEKYGINPNQTNAKLSNDFRKVLDQVSDKIGKAEGYVKAKIPASKDSIIADVRYLRDKMGRYAGSESGKESILNAIKKKKKL
jgi:hypothetical protein